MISAFLTYAWMVIPSAPMIVAVIYILKEKPQ